MSNLESQYPALTADAVTNPRSARLLALLAETEKILNQYVPSRVDQGTTPSD